jgi:hypothetical protein
MVTDAKYFEAYRLVATQRLWNKQIYDSRYWVTASQTCYHGNNWDTTMSDVFYSVHAEGIYEDLSTAWSSIRRAGGWREMAASLGMSSQTVAGQYGREQNSWAWVRRRELYWPSDRRLSARLVPTLEDRGCRVVSATNPPQSLISVF